MLVFLVILIVLCIFGLMGDNNYSCDNGVYVNMNEAMKDKSGNELLPTFNSCMHKHHNRKKDSMDCLKNKLDYVHCVDSWQNIVLIIIISLAGLVLLVKLGCMFLPKSSSPLTAM